MSSTQSPGLLESKNENPKEEWKKVIVSFYVVKKIVAKKHLGYLTQIMLPSSPQATKKSKEDYESALNHWQDLIAEEENRILTWDKIGTLISQKAEQIKLALEICNTNTYRWRFLERQIKQLEKSTKIYETAINKMCMQDENVSCSSDETISTPEKNTQENSYTALVTQSIWNTGQKVTETASAVIDKWVFSPVKR